MNKNDKYADAKPRPSWRSTNKFTVPTKKNGYPFWI
jgi:hypothetical protein